MPCAYPYRPPVLCYLHTEGHGRDSDGEEDEAGHDRGHIGLGAANQAAEGRGGQGTGRLDTAQWSCHHKEEIR